jgi:hypothetical protein
MPLVFFGSLIISLLILIIMNSGQKIIMPSIDEEKSVVYVDENGVRYRYYKKELE